jgi:hypothetical protein
MLQRTGTARHRMSRRLSVSTTTLSTKLECNATIAPGRPHGVVTSNCLMRSHTTYREFRCGRTGDSQGTPERASQGRR